VRDTTFRGGQVTVSPVLQVPRQCPPSGRGSAYDRNFFISLEGLHYSEISSNIGRATFERNFYVTIGRTACKACSATWEFGYQFSICARTEENHGKP
jgi:hypothetical protein